MTGTGGGLVQGSAQKQRVAEPPCRPPSLTLSVHGAKKGPVPRAQVSSLWALPCPLPGVSDPLTGTDTLPFPSSPGITAADLVKPSAKRPRAAAWRWRPGAGALLAVPAPAAPRPCLSLLGVESPGDPACTGRLPAALGRRCAEGWLESPYPPPNPCGAADWLPSCASAPPPPLSPGVGAPILVAAPKHSDTLLSGREKIT